MAVKQVAIHCVEIEDRPGGLQEFLSAAASEGVDLECFTAFSKGNGKGEVCVGAKDASVFAVYAKKAGIKTTKAVGFIISGDDKAGAAAEAMKPLADAGVNGCAGAAMVCNGQYHMLVVVASSESKAAAKALGIK
jgi:hypothetical protein